MIVEVEGYRSQNLDLRRAIGNAASFYGEVFARKTNG